jgi:hypothetical protein
MEEGLSSFVQVIPFLVIPFPVVPFLVIAEIEDSSFKVIDLMRPFIYFDSDFGILSS